jgi:hypothetical protein
MRRPGKVIPFPVRLRRPAAPGKPGDGSPVEVRRCRDQSEALVVQSLLASTGIRAILRGHVVQSIHPFSVGAQAAVAVLVAHADVLRARAVLSRRRRR